MASRLDQIARVGKRKEGGDFFREMTISVAKKDEEVKSRTFSSTSSIFDFVSYGPVKNRFSNPAEQGKHGHIYLFVFLFLDSSARPPTSTTRH